MDNQFVDSGIIPFYLLRIVDVSGASGSGVVMQGMVCELDGKVCSVWQSQNPSYTVHDSLERAKIVHGHNNNSLFKLANDSDLNLIDRHLYLPHVFEMWHTRKVNELTRIGLVGRGVLTNNGGTIFRWNVFPYQIEFFQNWRGFKTVHVDNFDYVEIKQITRMF